MVSTACVCCCLFLTTLHPPRLAHGSQILLKCSSNDKKFVIEEAQRALQVRTLSRLPCFVSSHPLPALCCCSVPACLLILSYPAHQSFFHHLAPLRR